MADQATDHLAAREERLRKLVSDIEGAILDSETQRDHNVLALILLVRALDIIETHYPDDEVFSIMDFMIQDRRAKRRVPVTPEYIQKQADMLKWLP